MRTATVLGVPGSPFSPFWPAGPKFPLTPGFPCRPCINICNKLVNTAQNYIDLNVAYLREVLPNAFEGTEKIEYQYCSLTLFIIRLLQNLPSIQEVQFRRRFPIFQEVPSVPVVPDVLVYLVYLLHPFLP